MKERELTESERWLLINALSQYEREMTTYKNNPTAVKVGRLNDDLQNAERIILK